MKIIIASDKLTGKFSLKLSADSEVNAVLESALREVSKDYKISRGDFAPFYAVYEGNSELDRVLLDYSLECSFRNCQIPNFIGNDIWDVDTHGVDTNALYYEGSALIRIVSTERMSEFQADCHRQIATVLEESGIEYKNRRVILNGGIIPESEIFKTFADFGICTVYILCVQ